MIHYHGIPITPTDAAIRVLQARHAMVSFARPEQVAMAAEVCQSFVCDNGAFSTWKTKKPFDPSGYLDWLHDWNQHPGFDWCLIPDVIDGSEDENRKLCEAWPLPRHQSVPVWHLHESLDYLRWMCESWPRVALGSSGKWPDPGVTSWWERISEAMAVVCDRRGRPLCKLHGLRMLSPAITSHLPLSSADSCGVGRNIGLDIVWDRPGKYLQGLPKPVRAQIIADRYERHASASFWPGRYSESNFELLG